MYKVSGSYCRGKPRRGLLKTEQACDLHQLWKTLDKPLSSHMLPCCSVMVPKAATNIYSVEELSLLHWLELICVSQKQIISLQRHIEHSLKSCLLSHLLPAEAASRLAVAGTECDVCMQQLRHVLVESELQVYSSTALHLYWWPLFYTSSFPVSAAGGIASKEVQLCNMVISNYLPPKMKRSGLSGETVSFVQMC